MAVESLWRVSDGRVTSIVYIVIFKFILAAPRGMWDCSSPIRD